MRNERRHVQDAQAPPGTDSCHLRARFHGEVSLAAHWGPSPRLTKGWHRKAPGQPQWMGPTFQLRRCPRSPGEPPGHQKAVEEGASEAHDIWDRLLLPESPLLWRARAC